MTQTPDHLGSWGSLVPCVSQGSVSGAAPSQITQGEQLLWSPCWAPTWASLPWTIPCILDIPP